MSNDEEITVEERLEKAKKPGQDAMILHKYYGGKIEITSKACVRSFNDFAIWYSPGVAEPCKAIAKEPDLVYEHTCKWNTVAVVSDGTRVLGLGDIGPEAAMPVMEGKSMLFKYLGGVDSVPICLDTKDPQKIIDTVRLIAPSFGGINLEDISNPKCFDILDELRRDCKIPVWHDDQQGTACVTVAAAINAMKLVGKKFNESNLCVVGAGAAAIAISRLLLATGFNPKKLSMCDSKGILNLSRDDIRKDAANGKFKQKWEICEKTNGAGKTGGIKEAMKGADIVVAASAPGPGTIPAEWIKGMADDPVVFATANPIPEMWPWEAKEYGVKIFATGRSDFPNQVNNSMGFPAIFRGTLDVRAKTITDEMCIAAAEELAKCAEEKGIHEEYIIPKMSEIEPFPREAVAVALKAQQQGVARLKLSRQELFERADFMIRRSREMTDKLMKEGFIADAELAFNSAGAPAPAPKKRSKK
ncbi:NAD-dependent malic enzyme [Candidatus Methanoplasma termitum]|uniref:MaeA protein n=1 Tax=Candidatus Methanoplasma termitum TaxID=1577791 RepID=A0A0A7LDG7_9ARCH|nr:NADP-dependent malic enzyme [Candidatus Methanoplasma termitum]AIZ57038.1 NAD-dependent malic enzyme [Candidatus Methanoplasma termitum]MCL2334008.1 NADP-dependent malic enzyme [Candidatus Methanoplasma sp.]